VLILPKKRSKIDLIVVASFSVAIANTKDITKSRRRHDARLKLLLLIIKTTLDVAWIGG